MERVPPSSWSMLAPMGQDPRTVAVLAPMTLEMRPVLQGLPTLRRRIGDREVHFGSCGPVRVAVMLTRIGPARATRAAEVLLDGVAVDHVVVTGVAGGVGAVQVGELVAADAALDHATGDRFAAASLGTTTGTRVGTLATSDGRPLAPRELADLARTGVLGVDMETAAVARVCSRRGIPWSAFRGISDLAAETTDAAMLDVVEPDGSVAQWRLVRYLARDPRRLSTVVALARHGPRAARRAAAAALDAVGSVER